MKTIKIVFLIFIFSIATACSDSNHSAPEIEIKAKRIIQKLSKSNLDVFHDWEFHYRGDAEVWTKSRKIGWEIQALYFKEKDCIFFRIDSRDLRLPDYPCLIKIDTSKYQSKFLFSKSNNEKIKISAFLKVGTEVSIGENYLDEEVFGKNNPFTDLYNMSSIKDEIEVLSIFNKLRIGNFIEFYITNEDVLTYIPEELIPNIGYNDVWLEYFKRGKMIKKNWNLRKLDNPKQGG